MITIDQSYTIALIASVIISVSLAVAAMMHKRTIGVYAFVILKTALGLWALTSLIELYSKSIETKVFTYSLKYLFIVMVPVAWYIFGLYYANRITILRWPKITMLMIFPVMTIFWSPPTVIII